MMTPINLLRCHFNLYDFQTLDYCKSCVSLRQPSRLYLIVETSKQMVRPLVDIVLQVVFFGGGRSEAVRPRKIFPQYFPQNVYKVNYFNLFYIDAYILLSCSFSCYFPPSPFSRISLSFSFSFFSLYFFLFSLFSFSFFLSL